MSTPASSSPQEQKKSSSSTPVQVPRPLPPPASSSLNASAADPKPTPSSSTTTTSTRHHSRSPGQPVGTELQTLIRAAGHLSLAMSPETPVVAMGGNPLRRPPEIVPQSTQGVRMLAMDFGLSSSGGDAKGTSNSSNATPPSAPSSRDRSRTPSGGGPRRPSFPKSTTISPPEPLNAGQRPPFGSTQSHTGLPSTTAGGGGPPGLRAHVRASSTRPVTPTRSVSLAPGALAATAAESSKEVVAAPDSESELFLPSLPSPVASELDDEDDEVADETGALLDASHLDAAGSSSSSVVRSPPSPGGERRTTEEEIRLVGAALRSHSDYESILPSRGRSRKGSSSSIGDSATASRFMTRVPSSAEHSPSREGSSKTPSSSLSGNSNGNNALSSPGGAATSFATSLSAGLTGARGRPSSLGKNDTWDWMSFMDAYAQGRWDPFKIPNPPETPFTESSPPLVKLPVRPGSTSAPSSSASSSIPRASSPQSQYSQLVANTTSTIVASSDGAGSRKLTPGGSSSAPSSTTATPSLPQPKRKPFMGAAEFATTVRLAGATSSSISPFALPSPDSEHVDPLRAWSGQPKERSTGAGTDTSGTSVSAHSFHPPGPRKTKSGTRVGSSWTASAGGLVAGSMATIDSGGLASGGSGRLEMIPGTPSSELPPPAPGSTPPDQLMDEPESVSPRQPTMNLPMASAPLPQTTIAPDGTATSRRSSRGSESGDYFGDAGAQRWRSRVSGGSGSWHVNDGISPDSVDSSGSNKTILGRGSSYSGAFDGNSSTIGGNSASPKVTAALANATSATSSGQASVVSLASASEPEAVAMFKQNMSLLPATLKTACSQNDHYLVGSSQGPDSGSRGSTESAAAERLHEAGPALHKPLQDFPFQPTSPEDARELTADQIQALLHMPLLPTHPGATPLPPTDGFTHTGSHTAADLAAMTPEERAFKTLGWLPAPKPPSELERRRALYRFGILNSGQDVNFDRIAHLAKLVFNTKIVLVSMVDQEMQYYKSESGLNCTAGPRFPSFCAHAVLQRSDEPLIVLDTLKDWRFKHNPLVTGDPKVRFYAGAPLRTSDGHNIGSLCVIDDKPRAEFTPRQRHALKEFAAIVMRELELWRDKLHLRRRGKIQDSMEKFTRDCVELDVDPGSVDVAMNKVYQQAVQLIQKTLDVDGAFVLDLSGFELVQTTSSDGSTVTSYRADPWSGQGPATTTGQQDGGNGADDDEDGEGGSTPGQERPPFFLERADSYGPMPALPVLGSSEMRSAPEAERSQSMSGVEHHKLAQWLKDNPDGRIYGKTLPSWFKQHLPPGAQYTLITPVFNIDRNPFALICAYTCDISKEFLEGYELKYLRAIGLIILSAVLKRRLTLADKAKAQFISNISHELRTPLHGILVAGELLADTPLSTQQTSYLETVQACGTSLIETVNHVLDFSKLSGHSARGKGAAPRPMELQEVDLVKLIEDTVEGCWIGQKARFLLEGDSGIGSVYAPPTLKGANDKGEHVEFIIDIGLRDKGWKIRCEKGGIRRVLMNLISNSLKFTKDGYVQVCLRELPAPPGSKTLPLEISIMDTGKGISREFLKNQLFQPFSQEDSLQAGTGLGLAIVHSIVSSESVQGKLDVYSSEGLGTEIKVTLDAQLGRSTSSSGSHTNSGLLGSGLSVSLLGFSREHRGEALAREVLENYLEEWEFRVRDDSEPGWGDILIIQEDTSIIDVFTSQRNVSRPIILLASTRGDSAQTKAINAYTAAGGHANILFKPAGPLKLETLLKGCVESMAGVRRRVSEGYSRSSGSRSGSPRRSRTPSEPDSSVYSPFEVTSPSRTFESAYFNGPGSGGSLSTGNGSIAAAIATTSNSTINNGLPLVGPAVHQLSPSHLLQRRRSEEEREPRRKAKRPLLPPRSITYQPDMTSPLAFDGYSTVNTPAEFSQLPQVPQTISEDALFSPSPSSPGSVVSLADGGSVLKAASVVQPTEAVALVASGDKPRSPQVLVVEDNPINRRVLAAFLAKKRWHWLEAVNGRDGVDAFERHEEGFFDVILMDLSMPVLDGLGATKAIRQVEASRRQMADLSKTDFEPMSPPSASSLSANGATTTVAPTKGNGSSRVQILALTGLATPDDKRNAFAAGVDGYLVKPVSLKTLDSVFKKLGFGL